MVKQMKSNGHPPTVITPEEMRQALTRVLNSKHFINAPMKQRFLRLICEFHLSGKGTDLNEYLIGQEVFDRDQSYNPATDPIVRVGAHGVREKLTLYYQKEGANDEIKIEIPVGSYEPLFRRRTSTAGEAEVAILSDAETKTTSSRESFSPRLPAAPTTWMRRKWLWPAGFALVALVVMTALAIFLFVSNQTFRQQAALATASARKSEIALGAVWNPFLRNTDPTLLILSNPVVHRPANPADPDALTQKGISLTPEQAGVLTSAAGNRLPIKTDRPMQLVPAFNMYTGIGEAIGVYRLSALLHSAGEATILKQSRSVSPDDLKTYDVILLGSVYANQWSKPLSIKENFVYTSRSMIENLSPLAGEEREYRASFNPQTGALIEDHALITVTPGVSGDKTVMALAGIYSEGTEAAAEFATDNNYLNDLNQRLIKLGGTKGPPKYYQALLKVRVENSFPTKISIVTVRELLANGQ
jgi:hypothetical protein